MQLQFLVLNLHWEFGQHLCALPIPRTLDIYSTCSPILSLLTPQALSRVSPARLSASLSSQIFLSNHVALQIILFPTHTPQDLSRVSPARPSSSLLFPHKYLWATPPEYLLSYLASLRPFWQGSKRTSTKISPQQSILVCPCWHCSLEVIFKSFPHTYLGHLYTIVPYNSLLKPIYCI